MKHKIGEFKLNRDRLSRRPISITGSINGKQIQMLPGALVDNWDAYTETLIVPVSNLGVSNAVELQPPNVLPQGVQRMTRENLVLLASIIYVIRYQGLDGSLENGDVALMEAQIVADSVESALRDEEARSLQSKSSSVSVQDAPVTNDIPKSDTLPNQHANSPVKRKQSRKSAISDGVDGAQKD